MSGSIVNLNASAHQTAQELLPWFVLGTLDENEMALMHEHLRHCSQCQADLDLQRKVQGISLPMRNQLDVESALAKLRPQLQPQTRMDKQTVFAKRIDGWREQARRLWMPWTLALQTAALASLCIVLWRGQPANNEFHVLGAKVQNGGNIVVMFQPQTTEAQLRQILQASNTRLVDGPTVAGAYLLSVGPEHRAETLQMLHREPAVLMAESLDGGGQR